MRLLHAETKQFAEFYDQIPPYAILSHTWGLNELSFKDMERNGYRASLKTDGCCQQALKDGLEYVWIDTCCIDKSSSAELSEAINSMWTCYERAELCYAYLSDVPPETAIYDDDSAFCKSRWFTRGWTLQELLAPSSVAFYDASWGLIGRKSFSAGIPEFVKLLSQVTQIPYRVLRDRRMLQKNSVAQKMSWASHRTTKREEDTAYSLLGLFGINMPLLYGEGAQAFKRLQEEIIKVSDDETIFAWGFRRTPGQHASLFSTSPLDFENCGDLKTSMPTGLNIIPSHYSLTNKGLHIETSLCRLPMEGGIMALARLNCSELKSREYGKSIALVMERSPENHMILSRRCEAAPLLVPSKLFLKSSNSHAYVHRSMGHWLDEAFSGLKIQFSLFGDEVKCNVQELYPPAWRGILSSNPIIWYEPTSLISNHLNILFLVDDADRPNYVVWVDYTFRPNVRNLAPRELKFRAAFIKEGMTLAEVMINKKDVVDTALDWQEVLDFGDSDLRMQLSKRRELGFDVWIVSLNVNNKQKLPEREITTGISLRKSYGKSALSRFMSNEATI